MSWSDLPAELLARIADRITEHVDLARFRSVCPSWRSASAEHAARRRVPLLLLPSRQYTHANRRLWSLADDSITETPMPAACGRSFLYASPRGWTLGVADDLSATLLHPFTGASESLPALPPSFDDVHQEFLHQMAWDRSPDAVMISGGTGAYFCRLPGDGGSWSPTGSSQRPCVSRINYCDGMFYLHDKRSDWVTAVEAVTFAVVAAIEPPDYDVPWCIPERTLVVSSGELLLLMKMRLLFRGEAQSLFKVFRADCRSLAAGWSEITDGGIGDRAVFVDHLHGFCVEANGHNGVRRNCVYMASSQEVVNDDDRSMVGGRYTVSVLDLDDLTTQSLSDGNLLNCTCDRFWQWPSWVMPNLHHHHRERDSK